MQKLKCIYKIILLNICTINDNACIPAKVKARSPKMRLQRMTRTDNMIWIMNVCGMKYCGCVPLPDIAL